MAQVSFRPLHDWILVKYDPLPEKEGSLFLVHGSRVRTATVLRTGPGRVRSDGSQEFMDLQPGERVVFYREHLEHGQGKQLGAVMGELGEDLALIRVPDVLFVLLEEVHVS